MTPTKRRLVDQTKPNKKIKHSTSTLVVAAPHQTSIVPMPPTKRGPVYVASPQNEPNKRITRANSSLIVRAPHENGEHPNKLWKMPTLPEHGIVVTAHNCRDLETCLKPSGTPKKNWMELNVCSFSDRENNAPVFPEDVEFEILVRLPVQSLLRFRCVSKSWCALIRSPTFIKRHLRQQKKGSVLLIRRSFRGREKKDVFSFHNPDSPYLEKLHPNLSIPFLKDFKYPRRHGKYRPYYPEAVCVLGPCNGLVCIIHREDFILCNPSLREFKHLPECPYAPPPGYKHGWEGYGFGRASNGDLKVVLIRPIYDEEASYILIYVYNSRIGAWTKIDCDSTVMARNYYKLKFQVFLNGACHWIASNMSFSTRKFCFSDFILSFDINTEVIRRRELPDFLKNIEGSCNMLFTNLNECLAVFLHSFEDRRLELWVMREYGVEISWTKQFIIQCDTTTPVAPWKNGECLLSQLSNGQLASFALDRGQMKRFKIYGAQHTLWALLYEESLISVNELSSGLVETGKKLRGVLH